MEDSKPGNESDYSPLHGDAIGQIENEVRRRIIEGSATDLIWSGASVTNPVTGSSLLVRKYSDALLTMILRANRSNLADSDRGTEAEIIREMAADPDPPRVERGRTV